MLFRSVAKIVKNFDGKKTMPVDSSSVAYLVVNKLIYMCFIVNADILNADMRCGHASLAIY